jgi:ribonuclease HIII
MPHYKLKLGVAQQQSIEAILRSSFKISLKTEQYCRYRFDIAQPAVCIKQYTNGTFYLNAQSQAELNSVLQTLGLPLEVAADSRQTPLSHSTVRGKVDLEVPYIGSDESGKGDYFGPLVIAAALFNPKEDTPFFTHCGIKDSKVLTNTMALSLAAKIKEYLGSSGYSIVTLLPDQYNGLYETYQQQGKNLNHLLAWGHATVIETLAQQNQGVTHAIADQFGNERYIQSQLQQAGKKLELIQTPKAEVNLGVAAASILARAAFLEALAGLSQQFGLTLPPGAGPPVLASARRIAKAQGVNALRPLAKLHFKTTQQLF